MPHTGSSCCFNLVKACRRWGCGVHRIITMRGHSLSARSLRGPSPPFGNHFRVLASPPFQAQELHTQMLCTQLPEQGSFQGLPLASWKSRGHFPPDMVICSNAAPPHTHTHTHTHTQHQVLMLVGDVSGSLCSFSATPIYQLLQLHAVFSR